MCVLALDAVLGRIETRYCTTGEGLFHGRKTVHVSTCCMVVPICFGPRRITFFLPALHVYIAPYISTHSSWCACAPLSELTSSFRHTRNHSLRASCVARCACVPFFSNHIVGKELCLEQIDIVVACVARCACAPFVSNHMVEKEFCLDKIDIVVAA